MKLENIVQAGDLIFVHGSTWVSKAIQKLTFSHVNHVGIIYDQEKVFETDIAWGKASLRDLLKYNKVPVIILRPLWEMNSNKIRFLCEKYNNTPYSWLDIVTNALLSPFKNEIREKIVSLVGTKRYAICSELTARILYEESNKEYLKGYEGYTPQDLLDICIKRPSDFQIVVDQISPNLFPQDQ